MVPFRRGRLFSLRAVRSLLDWILGHGLSSNPLKTLPPLMHELNREDLRPEDTLSGAFFSAPTPLAWFLPGPVCMRGGAARHFASDWLLHRGIQAEATCRVILGKVTHYQRLAESRSWRAGFFCGIQGIQFVEATTTGSQPAEATCQEAIESTSVFYLTKLPYLTYPLNIEE